MNRIFRTVRILCIILWEDVCYYTLVQTHRISRPRVNPNVNCGLWMVMLCQCRFILDKKCIILVSDVDYRVGRLCTCGGKGMREISTSFSVF